MTNKRKRFYEIALIVCCLIIIGLTAYMGITAIQKSLTLNLKFTAQPSKLIHIEYKLPSESNNAYKTLFCNVTDANEGLIPNVTASASLSGDTLTLTDSFDTLGRTFDFRITNYNDYDLKVTCAGVSKNTISDGNPIVFSNISTGGANVVFVFEEYAPTITFDFNGGKIGDLTSAEKKGTILPATLGNGYIPTRDGYTFAGYYSVDSTPEIIPDANKKCYSYDYFTNTAGTGNATIVSGINTTISDDITLHARWLPFIIGDYYTNTSQVTTSLTIHNGTAMTIGDIWKGYKYIQFANHETQESNYGNYSSRYIIIGAGNNLRDKLFDSTKAGFDFKGGKCGTAVTKSAYTESYYLTGPNTNPNNELQDNQILLLSEATLISQAFDSSGSALWQSEDGSEKSDINNYLNTTFLTNSGLSAYAGENSYILTTNLKTAWSPNSNSSSTVQIPSSTQIFLLASKYGYTSAAEARGKAISEYGQTKDLQTYTEQNFCVEDYLGDYIRYYSTTYYHNNPRIFTFNGVSSSYWWLRSGYYGTSDIAYGVYDDGYVYYIRVGNSIGFRPSFCLNLA